ncbi:hypothetical protein Y032_0482g2272 [Ancylostoma ceylanicum]|uniref:Uncharacterized protein n=1 Tax=Ancylostoma ceylanicum TaxID=53326 RepID=A0A016WVM1_9BILA|nr:hypothetical protein Y032_0482g2272 [Ancylostoma ceylanicum]
MVGSLGLLYSWSPKIESCCLTGISIASALFAIMYSGTDLSGTKKLYYCHATSVDVPARTVVPISALIVLQVSAVVILKVLECVNKKKSAKQRLNPDLRVRYNVGENLRTIRIVLPFCYVNCVFTSIFLAIMCTIMFFHKSFTKELYFALVDGEYFIKLLPFQFVLVLHILGINQ